MIFFTLRPRSFGDQELLRGRVQLSASFRRQVSVSRPQSYAHRSRFVSSQLSEVINPYKSVPITYRKYNNEKHEKRKAEEDHERVL